MGMTDHLTCLLRNLMQVKKQQLELDIERWTGSKFEREYVKAVYCHPAYLTYTHSSVQLFSHVRLFATPWTVARQVSLSVTNSQSLLKLMSIESVMPSNHLILCRPLLLLPSIFPSIRVFSNESILHIRWPDIGASASTSLLPMNIQDWFHLGGLVGSPYSPRDSQECSPTPQFKSINSSTSSEMPGWMKHQLESRLPGEITITSDMQMTPPLWQKTKRN